MNSMAPHTSEYRTAVPTRERVPVVNQTGAAVNGLTIKEVHTTEDFAAMAPEWRTLLAESNVDCLFLTWDWLYTWWICLGGSRRLRILTVHHGNALIGIAPFVLRAAEPGRLLPFRAVEFLGVGAVGSDYLDLIFKKGEEDRASAAIANHMSRWNYMLDMRRVALGSANAERLIRKLSERGWRAMLSEDDTCLYVPLSGSSWDKYFAGFSREFRRSLRRGRRSAQSAYAVTYVTARREEDRTDALNAFIRLHNKRWEARNGSQALPDSSIIRFHEQWSRVALNRGWLRLSILRFDQTPVAGTYGFSYGGKLYFYLSGFDPDYANYGVGRICMEEGLREAFEEELDEYDFLHGDEKYKYHWANDFRELGRYRLFPSSLRGHASRLFLVAREGIKFLPFVARYSRKTGRTVPSMGS